MQSKNIYNLNILIKKNIDGPAMIRMLISSAQYYLLPFLNKFIKPY